MGGKFCACTGHTNNRDAVDETAWAASSNLRNLSDALTRSGGWHQESDGNPMLLCCLLQWPGLFRWQVGYNQAADPVSCGCLAKSLDAKCQRRIIVAHQDQGDIAASRNLPGNLHTAVDCHS